MVQLNLLLDNRRARSDGAVLLFQADNYLNFNKSMNMCKLSNTLLNISYF